MEIDKIPWDEIDLELHPLVKLLNENGIETFASCSGHGQHWPWIRCKIKPDYGELDIILVMLKGTDYGFSVKKIRYVNSKKVPIKTGHKFHFWEIELWAENFGSPKEEN